MSIFGVWSPYSGIGMIILTVTLVIMGSISVYLGKTMKLYTGFRRPGKTVSTFLFIMWGLSVATLFMVIYSLAYLISFENHSTPSNPIGLISSIAAVVTFIIITYLSWPRGLKVAMGSAFVGAVGASVIFEILFDFIIMLRTYHTFSAAAFGIPDPAIYYLPLFLAEISCLALLTLSPIVKISKHTFYALSAMFFTMAIWAMFGFSYPSSAGLIIIYAVAKVLSFIVAITLFLPAPSGRISQK